MMIGDPEAGTAAPFRRLCKQRRRPASTLRGGRGSMVPGRQEVAGMADEAVVSQAAAGSHDARCPLEAGANGNG